MSMTKKKFQLGSIYVLTYDPEWALEVANGDEDIAWDLAGTPYKNKKGEDVLFMLVELDEDWINKGEFIGKFEALNDDEDSGMSPRESHTTDIWKGSFVWVQ